MVRKNHFLVKLHFYAKKTIYILVASLIINNPVFSDSWEQIATGSNFKEYFKSAVRTGRTASILAMRDYSSEMKQGDVSATWANTDLLKKLTGYAPKTDIKVGVKKFIDWYLSYYKINK